MCVHVPVIFECISRDCSSHVYESGMFGMYCVSKDTTKDLYMNMPGTEMW